MTILKLPYIHQFRDRHGRIRRYVRRKGTPHTPLPGKPGSKEFMDAYHQALESEPKPPPSRYGTGSIGALWTDYCRSVAYVNLSPSSRKTYRMVMASLLAHHGHRSVRGMRREHVRSIVEHIGNAAPAMGNLTIAVIRLLLSFAVENGWRTDNPALKIKKYKTGTHHSWTDQELSSYEGRWPLGTRERLAFDLLLYTGQRGGDVISMKRSDLAQGVLSLTQQKTGTALRIPIHPALDRSLKAYAPKGMHLIGDIHGRPIKRGTLTRLIRVAVKAAGLPERCVAHGLRKAVLRRLAEGGASEKMLAAVSGHKSTRELQRYTAEANQAQLAQQAINRLSDEK